MSRAVYLYLFIFASALLLLSKGGIRNNGGERNAHRRLLTGRRMIKLKSNFTTSSTFLKHETVSFDPLIAEIERKRDDREWERHLIGEHETGHHQISHGHEGDHAPGMESQPEWEEYMNAEDYVNNEDKFNVSYRLLLLFPKVDIDPPDGLISLEELTQWHLQQALVDIGHRADREMEMYDKNKDGLVSFEEYQPPSWVRDSENISATYGIENGWWQHEHFNASDEDGDGLLNRTEFNNFLHPADSKSPRLMKWLCREEVRERDSDKDGKLNFPEFYHGLFDLIRNYGEVHHNEPYVVDGHDPVREASAKKLFSELDRNNDGYITEDELEPVIKKLHPGEEYYARQQADYIVMQADDDKDGKLSLKEMLDHPYVFYSSIFTDEDDEDYHDEFR